MRIVFFGTSDFALPSLHALIASKHKVLAVITQPDRKRGRSLKLSPTPVKALAVANGIEIYQPENASSADAAAYLKNIGADLFVVVAFGQILRKNILDIPKFGSINLHGSLLPKYRGAAPTNWAIINGDAVSGVTVIRLNEKMDEGDIILKSEAAVNEDDTNITLSEKLSELGSQALLDAIAAIENNKAIFVKQDDKKATVAPKLKKEDGLISWSEPAVEIHNKVRGFLPWPGAYTRYNGKMLKILKTEVFGRPSGEAKTGEVLDMLKDKGMIVQTGSGSLAIQYLQLEGKAAMDAESFARGHKVPKGLIFS